MTQTQDPPGAQRFVLLRFVYRRLRAALALIGLFALVYALGFSVDQIVSPSMSPTLQGTSSSDGDWVISEKISYWFRNPHRWEVVRFVNDDGILVMKRVGGLPGETIGVDDIGRAVINGKPLDFPQSLSFLHYYPFGPHLHDGKQAPCGEGYFVFGDDSKDSQDSRYDGPIAGSRIKSRAWIRVWPWARVGWVNP
jgi:signal peptidase I